MPSYPTVDMEGVAQRLADLGADQATPVCFPASPTLQAGPYDTAVATVAMELVPAAALPTPDVAMQQAEAAAGSCEVAALKEQLEVAKMFAHAQQVRVCSTPCI